MRSSRSASETASPSVRFAARLIAAAIVALACASTALAAQRRTRGGRPPEPSTPSRPYVAPVLWEPEQIFPLALAHAGDLHLTDAQRTQIEMIAAQLRARNAVLLAQIDTLRPPPVEHRDLGSAADPPPAPTPEHIAAILGRRHALGEARAQLHDNTRLARQQLSALLTPEQQTRLAAEEESARNAAERGDPGG